MNPLVETLYNWLERDVDKKEIDATLEWLNDNAMLNTRGEDFAHQLWKEVWTKPSEKAEKESGQ